MVNHRLSISLVSVTKKYCISLVVTFVLDSSCSLMFYVVIFTLEEALTSSSLYFLASGEKCFSSTLLGILRFSQDIPIGIPAPHIFFLLFRECLRGYTFSQSCKARLGAKSLVIAFSRAVLNSQVCVAFSSPTVRFAATTVSRAHKEPDISVCTCACHKLHPQ